MNDRKFFINKMNPFLKIIILTIITIIGSFDFKPFVSSTLIASGLIVASLFSSMNLKEILISIKMFLIMSLGFMSIILITRSISGDTLQVTTVLAIGFRIILVSLYSAIFVKTTDPTEFIMALIKYFKVPVKIGYAFLTAYRFLPTFKDELEIIKYAHQVRGVVESRNPFVQVWNSKRFILPMMANAVRKGVRISMAMETRGFGKYDSRTTYRKLYLHPKEVIASSIFIIYILIIITILYLNNLTAFALIYKA